MNKIDNGFKVVVGIADDLKGFLEVAKFTFNLIISSNSLLRLIIMLGCDVVKILADSLVETELFDFEIAVSSVNVMFFKSNNISIFPKFIFRFKFFPFEIFLKVSM